MKIYSVLLIIILSLTTNIFSQVQFSPHTIESNMASPWSVYAIDIDGDEDIDVLSASMYDIDPLAWYENDGNQNFTTHSISTTGYRSKSVFAIDLDGDGDIDVIAVSTTEKKISWFENDGNENFTQHVFTNAFNDPSSVYALDVDGMVT